jgi:hypothetical protein
MMFLLKTAFWLGLVLVLLPTGSKKQAADEPQISAAEAATAATGAVSDLSQFCARRPETCAVGSQVGTILAQRAQAGAVMVYEFITERREASSDKPAKNEVIPVRHKSADGRTADRHETTGSIPAVLMPRPRPAPSQDTLTMGDRQTGWRAASK